MSKREYVNIFVVQANAVTSELAIDLIQEVVTSTVDTDHFDSNGNPSIVSTKEQEAVSRVVLTYKNAEELAKLIFHAIQQPAPEPRHGQQ